MSDIPSRYSKRGDTYEPIEGRVFNEDGSPADLRGGSLRFLAKSTINGVDSIIGESEADGICINVEDEEGPGDPEDIDLIDEFGIPTGETIATTTNRGRFRFEPTSSGVEQEGTFECELEATIAGKKITFPSKEVDNPIWQIDPDIA